MEAGNDKDTDITNGLYEPEPDAEHGPEASSILVIDDDEVVLGVLTDLLELRGFQVLTAQEGKAGIEVFRNNRPDLVITDISMPQMDGLQVLRRVRDMDECVPVILVTGHGDLDNAAGGFAPGRLRFPLETDQPRNSSQNGKYRCGALPA